MPEQSVSILEVIGLALGGIGTLVAIAALLVGLWHVYEIQKQVRELRRHAAAAREHTSALETLRRELSTRYIGRFPDYIDDIVAVISSADEKIEICCDFPAYGAFSNPKAFLEYRHALEKKLGDGVRVDVTCFNPEYRRRFSRTQFAGSAGSWESWRDEPQNQERLRGLLASHKSTAKPSELTQDAFIELLEQDDATMFSGSLGAINPHEVGLYIPLYYWLADENTAIFSIPSITDTTLEYGFRTFDPKLIVALKEMRHSINAVAAGTTASAQPQLAAATAKDT